MGGKVEVVGQVGMCFVLGVMGVGCVVDRDVCTWVILFVRGTVPPAGFWDRTTLMG